ncbi:MAG: hypothetical protein V1661_03075 [bacterium]
MPKSKQIVLTMNVSPEFIKALRWIAKRRGKTMAEVIHHAIGTEKFIEEAQKKGRKILTANKWGCLREVIFKW